MKMYVKEYNKVAGEPFRVEDYRGHKLEMFYFNDHPSYQKFVSAGRFSIWTSNGNDYRLLIEKGYYEKVKDLYDNEINNIWLDYTNVIYGEQKRLSKRYMLFSMIALVVVMGLSMGGQQLFSELGQIFFIVSMVLLFGILFGSSHFQQKALRNLVTEENKNTTNLIKETMGSSKFEKVLQAQDDYYREFFNVPEDEDVLEEEALEIEEKIEEKEDNDE